MELAIEESVRYFTYIDHDVERLESPNAVKPIIT